MHDHFIPSWLLSPADAVGPDFLCMPFDVRVFFISLLMDGCGLLIAFGCIRPLSWWCALLLLALALFLDWVDGLFASFEYVGPERFL